MSGRVFIHTAHSIDGRRDARECRDGHFVAVDSGQTIVYSLHHPVEGALEVLDDAPLLTASQTPSLSHHLSKETNQKDSKQIDETCNTVAVSWSTNTKQTQR